MKEYALITSNTAEAIGLEWMIRKVLSANPIGNENSENPEIIIRHFPDFADFIDDTPDMYEQYFISAHTFIAYNPFFTERHGRTVVLMHGTMEKPRAMAQGIRLLDLSLSADRLGHALQKLLCRSQSRHTLQDEEDYAPLSAREIEVLVLLCRGMINKEIAEELHISLTTVITHRKNITEKLGIKSLSGLTIYAVMNGYIEADRI